MCCQEAEKALKVQKTKAKANQQNQEKRTKGYTDITNSEPVPG